MAPSLIFGKLRDEIYPHSTILIRELTNLISDKKKKKERYMYINS